MGSAEQVDFYGFALSLTDQQRSVIAACDEKQAKRQKKWDKFHKLGQLPTGAKLKRYCRKGVPPQYRGWVWFEVSGAADRQRQAKESHYQDKLTVAQKGIECTHQIELDLPRTFPSNQWLKSSAGQEALRRVLSAFAAHKPDIGYCQSMNYVAGLLLLAMDHDEERAFWVMVALIDDGILYHNMYSRNLAGCHVELRSLQDLVNVKFPKVGRHLEETGTVMSMLATDWFLCLYCTSLPSQTAVRVWDALFAEGPKVLYRVALAMLQMNEAAIMAADNPGEILRTMKQYASELHDREGLMKIAFKKVGSMPMKRISTLRVNQQAEVDKEMESRQQRYGGYTNGNGTHQNGATNGRVNERS